MSQQFQLLRERRFLPYFITQALGAFNDNVYKNVLVIMVAFASADQLPMDATLFINAAAGLFILPFFLFSAFAGELADKYDKALIMRRVKWLEVVIMSSAAVALYFHAWNVLLGLLFLMGTQSAFFGPVKYALLPQTLNDKELVSGNALVETGTFLSILLGTLLAGFIAHHPDSNLISGIAVLSFALLGVMSAHAIPPAPAGNPGLNLRYRPVALMRQTLRFARKDKVTLQAILGISWFWFLGASYLTQFPKFTASIGGGEIGVSFLLTLFSVGIAVGALLCDKLSGHRIEPGIVPLGSLGLTGFGLHLFFATPAAPTLHSNLLAFITDPALTWVFIDLLMIGVCGGIFIVPLYSLMQQRADKAARARVIAANNIFNALFMVVSAILGITLLVVVKLSIAEFFLVLAVLNFLVAIYVSKLVPIFALRFFTWMVTHTLYRVKHQDLHHIPEKGGALLICNHVSYMDALLLAGACHRPIRFVMFEDLYQLPVLHWFFRTSKVIPISHRGRTIRAAMNEIQKALDNGEVVLIFPEGHLSYDGEIDQFRRGMDMILQRSPVPVIPMALQGLWGSYFSRHGGKAMLKLPKRFWSKVTVVAGPAVEPEQATSEHMRNEVIRLRADRP
ncbi:MFS transporter [Salinivibrio sp. PR6]|uniref:MFS transporter n=1 Tax=Salinivibrio sp. PR6 TaxID=1909485 RepID=UPI0009894A82|nr:MFS transporter [Salinivibrio sp. PR6]OOE85201.1 MFS transporter [Salinivibrio sp. PR6]